jgi:DNA-binding NtrC family response regulator
MNGTGGKGMGEGKRILIIEDDPSVTAYLSRLLLTIGYEVETADNGAQGLERAASDDISLIISDLCMPGEPSKMDLIRKLRELRPHIPLVVISGYPTQDRLEACREIGVTEFLTKPFEISFIRTVLKRTLESSPSNHAKGGFRP